MARKALGRGLDALIPKEGGGGPPAGGITEIPLDQIKPGPYQPRTRFDEDKLKELADSIRAQGLLQPLLVRPRKNGEFELIAGERRFRAAKLAGLEKAPALVREADDRSALEISLVENLQREELNPIEEANAYKRLMQEFGYTQEELAARVGKDRATVANSLRLLSLPEEIKKDLEEGRLSPGHARAILMAKTDSLKFAIREAVLNQGITVRQAEEMAGAERKKKKPPSRKPSVAKDTHLKSLEERMTRELMTKVRIVSSKKGGRIEIHFFSEEELERILARLLG